MERPDIKSIFILIIPLCVFLIIISQCECCKPKCMRVNRVDVQPIVVQAAPLEILNNQLVVIGEPLPACDIERGDTIIVDAFAINIP